MFVLDTNIFIANMPIVNQHQMLRQLGMKLP